MATSNRKPREVESKVGTEPVAKVEPSVEATVEPPVASLDDLINTQAETEPVQVEPEMVVFVAQEDFDGRINQDDYDFKKGVRVRMPREEANTWVEAKKGYIV